MIPLLSIQQLQRCFNTPDGIVEAVRGVDLQLTTKAAQQQALIMLEQVRISQTSRRLRRVAHMNSPAEYANG